MDFGKVFVINIKERTDRRESATRELNSIGITDINWFDAIKTKKGYVGCALSHLAVLEQCKGLNRFTIFEDDIQFLKYGSVSPLRHIEKAYNQLPINWDILYLGANILSSFKKYSDNLCRLKDAYCNHALIYNNPAVCDYVLSQKDSIRKIDVFFQHYVQELFNCFIVNPMIATQADSYSDIVNKDTSHTKMFLNQFKQNIKE